MAFEERASKIARPPSIAAPQAAREPELRTWPVPERILVEERAKSDSSDPTPHTRTESVLSERGPECLPCAKRNGCLDPQEQGASCDDLAGSASGCGGMTEREICYKTLSDIFTSKCAETFQETPCLCGATDVIECMEGRATPTGPLYRDYVCDFRTNDVTAILRDFRDPNYGVGSANVLIQCLGAYECGCFGN
jgi:hypothetical protein